MIDKMYPLPIDKLYKLIDKEYASRKSILGIPEALFFQPSQYHNLSVSWIGETLASPYGVAAGPQTQMAQNIIAAWLCGARYIELKTIQTLDELTITKPCIDMHDEGYNCEWSQELTIKESFEEYLKAWIIIHYLTKRFNWNAVDTIFNMSIGYNLEGILKANVQWFLDKMQNCKNEKENMIQLLQTLCPEIADVTIPDKISNSITLSTMHGCPPDEIGKIASYLLENKKINTIVKLNPTLLGPETLRDILNNKLGYKTQVPDIAFEHDLKYPDALILIKQLQVTAQKNNLFFGIKLTNTLETINEGQYLDKKEKMVYMSGKALHAISIQLAKILQTEFNGKLHVTFSAGVDCFNIANVLACGLMPATVSSDLLKPGGYGRLQQYAENIQKNYNEKQALNYDDFIIKTNNKIELSKEKAALLNLINYSNEVIKNPVYEKNKFINYSLKTTKKLEYYDCIHAPCVNTCPSHQQIPEYLLYTSQQKFDDAFRCILFTNPFPTVLGTVCDHLCQYKCTRSQYDHSLAIRDVKRFIAENFDVENPKSLPSNGIKVAIIGAGPSGLSAAYYLKISGFDVEIFESANFAGGMIHKAIPEFRLSQLALLKDVNRILSLGIKINYNTTITSELFAQLQKNHNFVYVAIGAQINKPLNIPGTESTKIIDPIEFLDNCKKKISQHIGNNILIIGGGNTAMDVARAAKKLVQSTQGKVTIVYRRSRYDMPANPEEILAVQHDNISIVEYAAPMAILQNPQRLLCNKTVPTDLDNKGRRNIKILENETFDIPFDSIIPAIGQDINPIFLNNYHYKTTDDDYSLAETNVFIGGDARKGASNIINAVADGRYVAEKIIQKSQANSHVINPANSGLSYSEHMIRRSKREYNLQLFAQQHLESEINTIKDANMAITESARCLQCNEFCNNCVSVCPNRANYCYFVTPATYKIPKIFINEGEPIIVDDFEITIKQQYQIINIKDFCNECGNCLTFCPTSGAPYKDKPQLHLTEKSFAHATEGYTIEKDKDNIMLIYKNNDKISKFFRLNNGYYFENEYIKINISNKNLQIENMEIISKPKVIYLRDMFNMFMVFQAAEQLCGK